MICYYFQFLIVSSDKKGKQTFLLALEYTVGVEWSSVLSFAVLLNLLFQQKPSTTLLRKNYSLIRCSTTEGL